MSKNNSEYEDGATDMLSCMLTIVLLIVFTLVVANVLGWI